jgi:hypothetical protein
VPEDRVRLARSGQQLEPAPHPRANAVESLEGGDVAKALDPMALPPEEPRKTGERERRPSHPMDQQQPHLSSSTSQAAPAAE